MSVSPAMGREFEATEATDTARVVMLSHHTWREYFGGAGDVLGSSILLNGLPRTVVGVMPAGFIHPIRPTDFFLPFRLEGLLQDDDPVGARIRMGLDPQSTRIEIIGVVRDVRTSLTTAQPEPVIYRPVRQTWGNTFVVRTAGEPLRLANDVRRVGQPRTAEPRVRHAPLDHISIAAAAGALLLSAAVALALPVHRATRADPLSIMR